MEGVFIAGYMAVSPPQETPITDPSTLAGSHFMIQGEELEGESFSPRYYHNYEFSFTRNNSGQIVLIDHMNNRDNR